MIVLLLRNARILTMADDGLIEQGEVLIDGERIAGVAEGHNPDRFGSATLEEIDLNGKTVLPGLVNSHIHFTMWRSYGSIREHPDTSSQAFRAVRSCLNCLRRGITAARDMGHKDDVHLQLRDAIDAGVILGPRVFSAGNAIVMSYGHAHFICNPVDNTSELVAAIRQQVSQGCDFIKIIASHDDLWRLKRDQFAVPWFSQADLEVAANTAHEIGVPITAHANGTETIRRVIKARFDSLEHGIYLDDDSAEMMKDQGMFLVPTMTGYKQNSDPVWRRGPEWTERYAHLWSAHLESVRRAVRHGVQMAAGTDTLGDVVEEMELMCQAGLSPLEAIKAATLNGARLMKMDSEIGSVETGKAADLLVVEGDPLTDLSTLRQVAYVIRNGVVYTPGLLNQMVPASAMYAPGW